MDKLIAMIPTANLQSIVTADQLKKATELCTASANAFSHDKNRASEAFQSAWKELGESGRNVWATYMKEYHSVVLSNDIWSSDDVGLLVVPIINSNTHNYMLDMPVLVVKKEFENAQCKRLDGTTGNSLKKKDCRAATFQEAILWVLCSK